MGSFEAIAFSPAVSAQQVHRTGSFQLGCSADIAFPLFSPEGERLWIKEWNPQPIFPETVTFRPDTVFHQGKGAEHAVWTIIDADWQEHRAEYVRVAPASHAAHIVVQIETLDRERSQVRVSYTLTAFGPNAPSLLESFSESAYTVKMQNWQRWIGEYLQRA